MLGTRTEDEPAQRNVELILQQLFVTTISSLGLAVIDEFWYLTSLNTCSIGAVG